MIKLINDDFKNYRGEEKADLILTDIPYNIGRNAYASNPRWWNNGNVKDGKSEKADSMFFETDEDFNIDSFLEFCKNNLKEDSSVVVFCSFEEQFEIISKKMIKNWFNMKFTKREHHPNEKDVELLEQFIKLFTNVDDHVIDFCMWGGST